MKLRSALERAGAAREPSEHEIPPLYFALIVAALAIGLFARLSGLALESLWLDEAYGVYWARQPVLDILTEPQADAKLFTLLQKVALFVVGDSDFTVRLVPLVASLLTTVFVYRAARVVGGDSAWAAAALYLVYPIGINFSRIGRAYSVLLLAASAFLWLSLRFLGQPRRDTFGWALGAWVMVLYSHKSGYFLGPLLIALIALRPEFIRAEAGFVSRHLILGTLACVPLVMMEISAMTVSQATYANAASLAPKISAWLYPFYSIYNLTPQTLFAERGVFEMMGIGQPWTALAHVLYLVPLGLGVAALWAKRGEAGRNCGLLFLILWAFTPQLFMTLLTFAGMPVYIAGRNDLALLLPMVLLPACGLALIRVEKVRALLIALILLTLAPYHLAVVSGVRPTFRGLDRANALRVSRAMGPRDGCIFIGHIYFSYERYFDATRLPQCITLGVGAVLNSKAAPEARMETFLKAHMARGARIWIMAPQDAFTRGNDLDVARKAVNDAAQAAGLQAEERAQDVAFDWQGKAMILRLSLEEKTPAISDGTTPLLPRPASQ